MLGLVLRKKYISSSITTEYDNSMKQLNQAKSNPGAGIFIIGFGITSSLRREIYEEIYKEIKKEKEKEKKRKRQ
jgi:hypothetical protein